MKCEYLFLISTQQQHKHMIFTFIILSIIPFYFVFTWCSFKSSFCISCSLCTCECVLCVLRVTVLFSVPSQRNTVHVYNLLGPVENPLGQERLLELSTGFSTLPPLFLLISVESPNLLSCSLRAKSKRLLRSMRTFY